MKSSLNSIFRTIWSEALGAWVAVSELTKTKGKRSSSSLIRSIRPVGAGLDAGSGIGGRLKPIVFAVACYFTINAQANPIGGQVVNGQADFNTTGSTLTVTNTPGTIINWQGFSINSNEVTHFAQQSASSAVLNRVITNNPSAILGTLSSNGRVFLVNPSGIVFGAGATVNVAGMVATSLNLSDADFLAGRHNFTAVAGAQNISNAGNITAQQNGQIYLIAPNVENTGIINAPNGEVLLVAGHSVELVNDLDPNLRVNITAPAGDATNIGQLIASSGTLGLFGTVVKNTGAVSADSATMQGGKIVFRSSQRTEVSGTASAQGVGGGEIKVLSDMQNGTVQVSGTLDASAPTRGDGGFVETSAHHIAVSGIRVDASAKNGDAGEWLIDPADIIISTGTTVGMTTTVGGAWGPLANTSYVDTGTIEAALNLGTSVTITTVNPVLTGGGNISVWNSIAKTAGTTATLTLLAENNIDFSIGAGVSSTSGVLNVVLRADSDANSAGTVTFGGTNAFSLLGGRVDLYYNPTAYITPTNYSGTFGVTPFTAWMLVNSDINLQDINTNLAGNYALGKNIVASTTATWNFNGTTYDGFAPITGFYGSFDGQGHTVDGLTINRPLTDFVGLFGTASGAKISNVTLNNVNITGQNDVGGLVGQASTSTVITNSGINGGSVTGGYLVGGLVGYNFNFSTINTSNASNVTVTAGYLGIVGGLVGYNDYYCAINNSSVTGVTVSSIGSDVGGMVGKNYDHSTLAGSNATGVNTVTGATRVGGLVGFNNWFSVVSASNSSSTVSGTSYVGGLIGYGGYSSSISGSSSASGNVTGVSYVGGLAGLNAYNIVNSSATGTVSGTSYVGGLVGYNSYIYGSAPYYNYTYGHITNSFATGAVTGSTDVGGLVGYSGGGTNIFIDGASYATGNVTGFSNVGGLVGNNYSNITNAHASGSVTGIVVNGVTSNSVGGLVGSNVTSSAVITNAYASGSVVGGASVGGLVGTNGATIDGSYVLSANVSGNSQVGGLVGSSSGGILNSYVNGGSVSGVRNLGGLVGTATGTITNSYYNINGVTFTVSGTPVGNLVTRGGIYSGQFTTWYNGGVPLSSLTIGTYLTQDVALNYQIGTVQNLRDMLAFADNSAYSFILTNTIDLTGNTGLYIPYLAADFNGAGLTISNLNIVAPNTGMGMFGVTANTATVSNLTLQDATVNGFASVGAIIGKNSGILTDSHSVKVTTGLISGTNEVGGLVGSNTATVTNSHATNVAVSGVSQVGGLIGSNIGAGTVTNGYVSTGVITATGTDIGGLIGLNTGSRINSYYSVEGVTTNGGNNVTQAGLYIVQFNNWYNGGVLTPLSIGNYASLALQVDGSYGINTLQGMKDLLGFAEDAAYNFSLTGDINLGTLPGFYVPQLAGNFNGNNHTLSNISYSMPNSDIGLFGTTATGKTISNLVLDNVDMSGNSNVGGLVGNNLANISNVSITSVGGASVISAIGVNVGGLVGYNFLGNISASHVSGGTVSGVSDVGGLVGYNGGNAVNGAISNSDVSNTTVNGTGISTDSGIGGLVGTNSEGNISGSHVLNANVNGGLVNGVGGLVGSNYGDASSSSSIAVITRGVISNSYVSGGTVQSTSNDVGGLVGYSYGSLIDTSYVSAVSVSGTRNVGGLIGNDSGEGSYMPELGVVRNSYALNTQVTGNSNVGGLIGRLGTSSGSNNPVYAAVSNSYVSGGTVTSNATSSASATAIGGLVGYNNRGNISGSYVTNGTVVNGGNAKNVGGLVGMHVGSSSTRWYPPYGTVRHGVISNSYVIGGSVGASGSLDVNLGGLVGGNSGFIDGSYVSGGTIVTAANGNTVGGLVGRNFGSSGTGTTASLGIGTISNSYVDGGAVHAGVDVSGAYNVGGLVGRNDAAGIIDNSHVVGLNVVGTSSSGVGGLVGRNLGGISGSYVSGGSVVGVDSVGGLVGLSEGAVTTSYVSGVAITGVSNVGGLVGNNASTVSFANSPSVDGSYVSGGSVSGTTNVGGVVGLNAAGGLVGLTIANYFDSALTLYGIGSSLSNSGAEALSAAQMKVGSNFVGWNITNTGGSTNAIWRIYDNFSNPLLLKFLTPITVSANNASKIYDGIAYSGDNGYSTSVAGAALLGSIGGSSQGAVNVGTYVFDVTGLYSGQLGYDITTYTDGELTISPAGITLLSVTASDASKLYGTTYTFNGTDFTPVGLLGGDTIGSVTLSSAGAVSSANAGSYAITPSNAVFSVGSADNYSISYVDGTLTVTPRSITLTAPSLTRTYNGTTTYTATTSQLATFTSALVAGDVVNDADMRYADKNVGTNKVVTFNSVAINDGNGGANYNVTLVGNSSSTIDLANLIVTALPTNKVLGTSDPATLPYSAVNLFDPVATVLSGSLVRDPGELIGRYAIQQGSLMLIDTQNYTMTYVAGTFRILAPTVVQEITQTTVGSNPDDEENAKQKSNELLADATTDDGGLPLVAPLPVCQ